MAKIGEGDPRWIVSQRDDGKNVNAWHWEERDLTKSTHEALREAVKGRLIQLPSSTSIVSLSLTELSEVDGDVTVAQRKGKIMCYFEIKCTAKWEGQVKNGEETTKVEGKLTVPEVDHDTFGDDDYTINVTAMDKNEATSTAEGVVRSAGRKALREAIKSVFNDIFKTYSVGQKVGGPDSSVASLPVAKPIATTTTSDAAKTAAAATSTATKAASTSSAKEPTSYSWKLDWHIPLAELYSTLTDERKASGYTRAPASIDPRPSGCFSFLNGTITGYYTDIVMTEKNAAKTDPAEADTIKITMQWRLSSWATGVHSSVVMNLTKEANNMARMDFAQAGIPLGEIERVKRGWQVNFFEPIKMMMGYNFTWA